MRRVLLTCLLALPLMMPAAGSPAAEPPLILAQSADPPRTPPQMPAPPRSCQPRTPAPTS
ncbi:hypothetical protein [Roseomonas sp. AR75]|uniref:hypothetical protein n=1 Tax=Roseomonas sp. AR75 TaxID=2562311 RepID=UPI0010C09608|nr:hypothetical protein [Roseomonas sp. AR75]